MIRIVKDARTAEERALMEKAHRLRHAIFVEELGWKNTAGRDGLEIDRFDTPSAVHFLAVVDDDVVGNMRMLPTTEPHLLSEVFSDLCEVARPCGPHVWESTRYCTAKTFRESQMTDLMVRRELLYVAVKWALDNGVSQFLFEIDPYRMLRLIQYHFRMAPLGLPRKIGGEDVIAAVGHLDRRTLDRLAFLRENPTIGASGNAPHMNRSFTRNV